MSSDLGLFPGSRPALRSRIPTRLLTWAATLIALSVVLTRVASVRIPVGGVEAVRIGFGALPILMAGIWGGPVFGFLVGAVADLVGYGINPMGPYVPLITLSSGMLGLIPGLVLRLFPGKEINFGRIAAAVAAAEVLVGMVLTPWFLHLAFLIPYAVLIPPRLVSKPLEVVLFSLIIHLVTVPLARRGTLPAAAGR
ncbi:MAG: folate family ECF transporter S component [Bacillota bacterium]|nr:folate family ECF transporter S component [Bacillota bacterium]MDI7250853.1 folate family ECF transporter S component [Bacillota bacterium]